MITKSLQAICESDGKILFILNCILRLLETCPFYWKSTSGSIYIYFSKEGSLVPDIDQEMTTMVASVLKSVERRKQEDVIIQKVDLHLMSVLLASCLIINPASKLQLPKFHWCRLSSVIISSHIIYVWVYIILNSSAEKKIK